MSLVSRRPDAAAARRVVLGAWAGGSALASFSCLAADPASATPSMSGALLQGLLGLAAVLAILYGFFWLLRRMAPGQSAAQGVVRVVGGVMLGPRERLVVVEVADKWLLIGVATGHVSHLHTLDKPAGAASDVSHAQSPSFAGKLAELLARRKAP